MASTAIEIRAGQHVGQISTKTIARLSVGKLPRGTGYIYKLVAEYGQALRDAITKAGLPIDESRDHYINEALRAERHALYMQFLLREPDRAAERAAKAVRQSAAELPEGERPTAEETEQQAAQAAHKAAQQHALSLDHRIALSREIVRATRDRNRAFDSLGLGHDDAPHGPTFDASFAASFDPPADDPPADDPSAEPSPPPAPSGDSDTDQPPESND